MPRPNLFVVGAMKAGTTTVYHHLRHHPEIFMSAVKEPQYFIGAPTGGWQGPDAANTTSRDLAAYEQLFDGAGEARIVGEASPVYLCDPGAAAKIQAYAPDARIVAVLRQPVDRAYSAWLMKGRHGYERLGFAEALAEEPRRIAQGWRYAWHYAALGCYAGQVERFFASVGRAHVHVAFYDDLVRDPAAVMRGIFRFLGVDDGVAPPPSVDRNPGFAVRSGGLFRWLTTPSRVREAVKPLAPSLARPLWRRVSSAAGRWNRMPSPPLAPDLRQRLTREWADEIRALERLLGADLARWRA